MNFPLSMETKVSMIDKFDGRNGAVNNHIIVVYIDLSTYLFLRKHVSMNCPLSMETKESMIDKFDGRH